MSPDYRVWYIYVCPVCGYELRVRRARAGHYCCPEDGSRLYFDGEE